VEQIEKTVGSLFREREEKRERERERERETSLGEYGKKRTGVLDIYMRPSACTYEISHFLFTTPLYVHIYVRTWHDQS
jgi:hypothetical protein